MLFLNYFFAYYGVFFVLYYLYTTFFAQLQVKIKRLILCNLYNNPIKQAL